MIYFQQAFKTDLLNIARTTLSSKLLNVEKNHFAQLSVDAVKNKINKLINNLILNFGFKENCDNKKIC